MMTPHEIDQLADAIAAKLSNRPDDVSLLNKYQAAALLGCSVPTIERLVSRDQIKSIKVGRLRRFRRSDLLALNEQGGQDE